MKAVYMEAPKKLLIKEVEDAGIKNRKDVVVKVKAGGICGTDLHFYSGHSPVAKYPNVMGHEIAGVVQAVGDNVKAVKPGDRVVVDNVYSCGECYPCRHGRNNICSNITVLGAAVPGGFSEYITSTEDMMIKIPDDMSFEVAAMIEPYSIVVHSYNRSRLRDDDFVLICGAGPLGLMQLQYIRAFHKDVKVAVLDIIDTRIEKALQLGADLVINGMDDDVKAKIDKFTDGLGMTLIFEITGNIKVFEDSISDYSAQGARIVVVSLSKGSANIELFDIFKKELDILGSRLSTRCFKDALKALEEKLVDPAQLITHRFEFEKADEAFSYIIENKDKVFKGVFTF